jgi:electron transport complex protein RnfE
MAARTTLAGEVIKGLWKENPVLVVMLGFCPTLAVTSTAYNGLGMGAATTVVLICSNILIALVKPIVPKSVRIPVYIVVIATFVTVVEMLLKAFQYDLSRSLGLFVPLIVVNCIILGRAEAFASRNTILRSALDGVGMSLGFTVLLFVLGAIREVIGSGTLTLFQMGESVVRFDLAGGSYPGVLVMILPPGAFLTLGFLLAGRNLIQKRLDRK